MIITRIPLLSLPYPAIKHESWGLETTNSEPIPLLLCTCIYKTISDTSIFDFRQYGHKLILSNWLLIKQSYDFPFLETPNFYSANKIHFQSIFFSEFWVLFIFKMNLFCYFALIFMIVVQHRVTSEEVLKLTWLNRC